jgi:DNA-binding beta-propeller fold protein YncE
MGKLSSPFLLALILPGVAAVPAAAQPAPPAGLRVEPYGAPLGKGELREPLGLDVDAEGNVYAADAMTGKIFRFSPDGTVIEFEKPHRNSSMYPLDLAVDGSFVYVLDYTAGSLLRYDDRGSYLDILISFSSLERTQPVSVTSGGGGRLVTTDLRNNAVTVWTPLLDVELSWSAYGRGEGAFDRPAKAAILQGERIAVADLGNRRVQLFSPAGAYLQALSPPDSIPFNAPRYLCADMDGNLFVADTGSGAVYVFSPGGALLLRIDSYLGDAISPSAVAAGWNDDLYVADLASRSILVFRLFSPGK